MQHRKPSPFRSFASLALCTAAVALLLAACRGHPPGAPGAAGQGPAEAEWRWLTKTRLELDRRREAIRSAPEGAERDRLAAELETLTEELNRRLVAFLNADPPREGQAPSERQRAALRMKSDEDILVAQEYIDQGGDFATAIAIYRSALAVDPDYPRLKDALAAAETRRFMTRELFSRVKEGMKPEEVRLLLGQPNPHNVREYPEHRVLGWFYPKDASGAAAAVWFETAGGGPVVYRLDFDAVAPPGSPPLSRAAVMDP